MMKRSDVELLRCPACQHGRLIATRKGADQQQWLGCQECGGVWHTEAGMPVLYREHWIGGNDRLMRHFYDNLPRLHDPAVRYLLPAMQLGGTEDKLRGGYLPYLELDQLAASSNDPIRILEVGIGGGANLPLVHQHLPGVLSKAGGRPLEYWGLDLSRGMLAVCQRRVQKLGYNHIRLLLGDAHRLPFGDNTFDRVFHVGGIGGYADPALGLAEMARVAVPGSPIVVVDEALQPGERHNVYQRLMFAALTFYDDDPHCPTDEIPAGAWDVAQEQVSRFYYALRFRLGGHQQQASVSAPIPT